MNESTQENHTNEAEGGFPPVEPMTWSLLGRFFGVPLLIISLIVGGAIAVVLLFGGPGTPHQRTIDELLAALESGTGERTGAILLPREKELWLMALELSGRLEKRDAELTSAELITVTTRLARMVERDVESLQSASLQRGKVEPPGELWSRRLEFLIHALGRTGRAEAIEPLIHVVVSDQEPYVAAAVLELGNLHEVPEAKAAVDPIVRLLSEAKRPETLMVGCTALSVLADRGNAAAVKALQTVLYSNEGEVAWSAALALARLGDGSGRTTLLDMLDRGFWEKSGRYQIADEKGAKRSYDMPPQRVEVNMAAAMDAASRLDDPGLWEAIDRLKSDPSYRIRARVDEVLAARAERSNH